MAQSVSGASPVSFISEDTQQGHAGEQYQIPLPFISYDPTKTPAVSLTAWKQLANLAATDQLLAVAIVQTLINQGFLTPVSG